MEEYWENAYETEPKVAPLMNNITKIVCSRTLEKAEWNNTTIVRDAVSKEGKGSPLCVLGSATLSESLMSAGLFDEIRLCIAPAILEEGRHLFTNKNTERNPKLLETRSLENGGAILRYEVVN